jgi:hypothetical protein
VQFGLSLQLANCPAIGIDPRPQVTASGQQAIYAMTSDEYFTVHPRPEMPIDLAFIDGMHLFEFALRDFINIQRLANERTIIVFDDVLPYNAAIAGREPLPGDWTGDVWKLWPILMGFGYACILVDVQPTGVLVVYATDSEDEQLARNYEQILKMYMDTEVPRSIIERTTAHQPDYVIELLSKD